MNSFSTSTESKRVFAALVSCCLAGCAQQPSQGTASNGQADSPGPQALNPYQHQGSISDSTTCPSQQCIISFPTVPAGHRLVITNVSAQLGPQSNQLVLEGSGSAFFVPKSDPNIGYLAVPVTVYYEAGSTRTARIFAQNTAQHTSLIVTLVGYLVPIS
jgi:hypothetical protein